MSTKQINLALDDAQTLRSLFGVEDSHLRMLEQQLGIAVHARGNQITLQGTSDMVERGKSILDKLTTMIEHGQVMTPQDIASSMHLLLQDPAADLDLLYNDVIHVPARRRAIRPRTPGQKAYLDAIRRFDMVFGIGPAGTGKTYLAMAMAVESLMQKRYERLILCRPAVEAGEKLGFLPGSMQEKVNPYLRPLYDALHDMMEIDQMYRLIEDGAIEVAPLAFMRGRTLSNSFVILDEGQNCTPEQMKMFLTRLGPDSRAVITGDITQIDLPDAVASGLVEAIRILNDVEKIHIHFLTDQDVVRHALVQAIVNAYETKGGRGI